MSALQCAAELTTVLFSPQKASAPGLWPLMSNYANNSGWEIPFYCQQLVARQIRERAEWGPFSEFTHHSSCQQWLFIFANNRVPKRPKRKTLCSELQNIPSREWRKERRICPRDQIMRWPPLLECELWTGKIWSNLCLDRSRSRDAEVKQIWTSDKN